MASVRSASVPQLRAKVLAAEAHLRSLGRSAAEIQTALAATQRGEVGSIDAAAGNGASGSVVGIYLVGIPMEVGIKCSEFNMRHNSLILAAE